MTESYVKESIPRHHRQILAKLRTGSLHLRIETGRWNDTPLEQRTCNLCDGQHLENEVHFAVHCSHYDDIRQSFYDSVQYKIPHVDLSTQNHLLLFISLMHSRSVQRQWAAALFKMYERRQFNIERII